MNRITEVMNDLGLLPEAALSMKISHQTVTVEYETGALFKAHEARCEEEAGEPESTPFDLHPLEIVFDQCVEQAVAGKGEERHGHGVPFMEQPWHQIADRQGLGFLVGQAEKKIGEASTMLQQNPGADGVEFWQKEIRGAINYLAMAMLYVEEQVAELTAEETSCGDCQGCACGEIKAGPVPMQFDPVTGEAFTPLVHFADDYRAYHGPVAWLFNPWTGGRRDPRDIGTDPLGRLIAPF